MIKTFLSITIITLFTASAFAQNRSRVFDNFDTTQGVEITVRPTVAEVPAVKTKRTKTGDKRVVQKTSQTMAVQEGLGARQNVSTNNYSKMTMGSVSGMRGFTTGDAMIDSFIVDSSRRYGIDPLLIYSQMHQESSFKLRATSYKGASGLMQLMPGTARRFGVTDIYDPRQNIDAGVKYMRWLLDQFGGDISLALAGYNAGEGAVWKYGNQIPPYNETREYVRRITGRYSTISNPAYARTVKTVTTQQAAKLEKREAKPLTVYEASSLTIRTPDGRLRLVN